MLENGFYKIKQEYIDLVIRLGGKYQDSKSRPVFCCMKDNRIPNLYWAIPTSDYSHRTPEQQRKIQEFCLLNERDIRYSYYFIGHTNRPAIYRISSCLPMTDKYIDSPYISQGSHLFLVAQKDIKLIRKKLGIILLDESKHPNKYKQHITAVKNYLINEMANH